MRLEAVLNQRAECAPGKYNSATGSVDESACMKCAPGEYNSMAGSDAEAHAKECDQESTTMRLVQC